VRVFAFSLCGCVCVCVCVRVVSRCSCCVAVLAFVAAVLVRFAGVYGYRGAAERHRGVRVSGRTLSDRQGAHRCRRCTLPAVFVFRQVFPPSAQGVVGTYARFLSGVLCGFFVVLCLDCVLLSAGLCFALCGFLMCTTTTTTRNKNNTHTHSTHRFTPRTAREAQTAGVVVADVRGPPCKPRAGRR
jgi:hypothetical protein